MHATLHNLSIIYLTKVCWCADYGSSKRFLADYSGEAEVAQLHLWELFVTRQQNVFRLQVAMDYVFLVKMFEGY